MRSIGQTLKILRTSSKLSVDDVLYRLKERNIVVSSKTLYGYENGNAIRSCTFLTLCEIYSVADIFTTFLQGIPYAKEAWADTEYEDYFNGRTVNEKFDILVSLGIPPFTGYEEQCSKDVFFGRSSRNRALLLSDFECEIITKLRLLPQAQQEVFLAQLTTLLNTQSP